MSPHPEKNGSKETLSDRRFRRYHRANARRAKAAKEDTAFYRAVFSIAGVGGALAIGLAVFALGGGGNVSNMQGLVQPWLGPFSKMEIMGIGVIICLGIAYLWRVRKR